MHNSMVKDTVLKARGMDNTGFGIADGKLTEATIWHASVVNVLCKLVDVDIKMLEKALNIRAVTFAPGSLLSGLRQIIKSGDIFQSDRHTLHDIEDSLAPFLLVPGACTSTLSNNWRKASPYFSIRAGPTPSRAASSAFVVTRCCTICANCSLVNNA